MHPRRLLLAPLLLSVACEPRTDAPASTAPAATAGPVGPAPVQRPTLVARDPVGASVVASLDTTVDPCTDFYRYACGGWMKKTTRPPDKARYGRGFGELADRNNALLRKILEDAAAARSKAGSVDAQLGSFWSACMDEAGDRGARASTPLAPLLSQVTAVRRRGEPDAPPSASCTPASSAAAARSSPSTSSPTPSARTSTSRSCCRAAPACRTATST
jgi:putative endopeptidase